MANEDGSDIPVAEIYQSDKYKFLAGIIAAALGPFITIVTADAGLPNTSWKWVVIIVSSVLAVANLIKVQGIPTPQHAGAMRFTHEAQKVLSPERIDQIMENVDLTSKRGGSAEEPNL